LKLIKKHKWIKRVLLTILILAVVAFSAIFSINAYVISASMGNIISADEASSLGNVDCILVLGCFVSNGTPSEMLNDRLLQGVELYDLKASGKLIMSGDHGQVDYDEVNVMKKFAEDRGVPSEDIFMDHAGFSRYESMYRARDIFQAKKIIIVTQKYHLYRALYIAKALGLDAYGVASDPREYYGQNYREVREILARNKDFFTSIFKPKPTYLGDVIPVNGDGNASNG
jgi:SanA protein